MDTYKSGDLAGETSHANEQDKDVKPAFKPDQPMYINQQQHDSEKLRAQYNQHVLQNTPANINLMHQLPPRHLPPPNAQQPGLLGYNMAIPPPSFAYPPPNMLAQQMQQQRPPNALLFPPPTHQHIPTHLHPHAHPHPHQIQQLPHHQMQQMHQAPYQPNNFMNVNQNFHHPPPLISSLPNPVRGFNSNENRSNPHEVDLNVNDDAAYDLDESENLSDLDNQYDYDDNYDIELDLNNFNEMVNSKKKKTSSSKRYGRRSDEHLNGSNESDHDDEEHELAGRKKSRREKSSRQSKSKSRHSKKQSQEEEELLNIKEMLKNVLEMRINDMESEKEFDSDLKSTLENLLNQVVDDDGSLTFEDYSNIHETVMRLIESDQDQLEGDSDSKDNEYELENEKKRKRAENSGRNEHRTNELSLKHGKGADDDLKTSRKKRKYQNNDIYGEKKSRRKNYHLDVDEQIRSNAEVEAGEIDDVYDDQFIVEQEFNDLVN